MSLLSVEQPFNAPYENGSDGEARLSAKIADRETPLIRNSWYALDRSDEVGNQLKNRMVLNQDLVYFRTKDGMVTALQNRCAHRCFPLHRGTLHDNDTLQCGYHGLTYDAQGQCVKIPSAIGQDPSHIKLHHYPVVERDPMIWIWPGDPDKADPNLIPDFDFLNNGDWGYGKGYYHVAGNYLQIHENLMDITHFQYLHGAALGTEGHAEGKITVTVHGDTVDNYRVNDGEPVPGLHQKGIGLGDVPVRRHAHSTYISPGFHDALGGFEDFSGTKDGRTDYRVHILHIITPETQYTSHYWWMFARDFTPQDKDLDQFYSDMTAKVFEEDKDAIEWIEDQWAKDHRPDFRESHVPADNGAVKMRRVVARLAEDEAVQSAGS